MPMINIVLWLVVGGALGWERGGDVTSETLQHVTRRCTKMLRVERSLSDPVRPLKAYEGLVRAP